jgi:hypothetical protein
VDPTVGQTLSPTVGPFLVKLAGDDWSLVGLIKGVLPVVVGGILTLAGGWIAQRRSAADAKQGLLRELRTQYLKEFLAEAYGRFRVGVLRAGVPPYDEKELSQEIDALMRAALQAGLFVSDDSETKILGYCWVHVEAMYEPTTSDMWLRVSTELDALRNHLKRELHR